GKHADCVLNSYVEKEVCPNNLAPTTSTTTQLVLGDALAVCLLEIRGFSKNDFAKFHPGGILGKKLFLTVKEFSEKNKKPQVQATSSVKEVIMEITRNRVGATAVVENDAVVGIITDGDLRRMLSKTNDFLNLSAADIMSKNPKTIQYNTMAVKALKLMESKEISQLLLVKKNKYVGVIHIHDLISEGII
ncbi:MAG: CBS domain-containing protein, partial [Bacteroidota bacterium]|nr:CBS domain-containing protein [Bacteroidota bacterium]